MSELHERMNRAREIIDEGDYFRILTHYDVDGVCSAGIIAGYLRDKGKKFHISFFRNEMKEEIKNIVNEEKNVIILDMGSSLINDIEGNIIVLDHHRPPGDRNEIVHINPHLFGYDGGKDGCASTLTYILVNDRKYLKFFLAGMMGDKQHIGGISGLNREIIEKEGIKEKMDFSLYGSLQNAIVYSTEPFFPGLSGKPENVEKMLKKLAISPTKEISSLTPEEKEKIGSYLAMNLIRNSKVPNAGRYIVDLDFDVNGSVRYLADLIDSSCRTDNQSIALGYILGGKGYLERMEVLRKEYKSKLIKGIYDMIENLFELSRVQYFYASSGYLGSSISTIASLYLLNPEKAVISLYVDDMVHISTRINRRLADKINIGEITDRVATALGGFGGGHNVAAGATIPRGKEENFVEMVNREIEKSLS